MPHLPIHILKYNILEYFQKAYPEHISHLEVEIYRQNGINSRIVYDDRKIPIGTIAEISEDHQITIYENFMAYLWSLCYAVVVFYNEKNEEENEEKIKEAVLVLEYGYLLKEQWLEWPNDLPNPVNWANKYVENANALMVMAMSYILAHEYGHYFLGHDLSGTNVSKEEMIEEEFSADNYAFDVLTSGHQKDYVALNNSINVSILLGLGSILLLDKSWDGGDIHPDINKRLKSMLEKLEEINNGNEEYWMWGQVILQLWSIAFLKKSYDMPKSNSIKADYEALESLLRNQQY